MTGYTLYIFLLSSKFFYFCNFTLDLPTDLVYSLTNFETLNFALDLQHFNYFFAELFQISQSNSLG